MTSLASFTTVLLCAWSILPFLSFLLSDFSKQLLFFGSNVSREGSIGGFGLGFSGYAFHKNGYAYVVGMAILSILFSKHNLCFKVVIIGFLFFLIVFSGCRSVLIAIPVAISAYYFIDKVESRKYSRTQVLMLVATLSIILVFFIIRYAFFDDENRLYIYTGFANIIKSNIIFGTGGSVVVEQLGGDPLPAHNFILQGIADRGIVAFIFFVLILFKLYYSGSRVGKVCLLYMLVVGLFQPSVSIGVPTYTMMPLFLMPIIYDHKCPKEIQEVP